MYNLYLTSNSSSERYIFYLLFYQEKKSRSIPSLLAFTAVFEIVAMMTNLIHSNSLITLMEALADLSLERSVEIHKVKNVKTECTMIFRQQRVWWHHYCHSNFGCQQENMSFPLPHSSLRFLVSIFCLFLLPSLPLIKFGNLF